MTDKRMLLPQALVASLLSGATQVSMPVRPQPPISKEMDHCPFPIGTVVWVPETWRVWGTVSSACVVFIEFRDSEPVRHVVPSAQFPRYNRMRIDGLTKWESPATMPSWAARYRAVIEGAKAGRLWDATEADAVADGFKERRGAQGLVFTALDYLITAWDDLYAKRGYPSDINPWRYSYGLRRL